jgi:PTH1 family peptidyl-tRNA hydrolase
MAPVGEQGTTRFVVGLGNPTPQYKGTRHNVGFMVLALLRQRWCLDRPRRKFQGHLSEARPTRSARTARVMLMAPQTFMNRSGQAVRDMLAFYKAGPEDCLVVLDDMALPTGRLRARADGSAGGHNGLTDVQQALGTQQVARLRIGIGSPPPPMDSVDYVLGRFRPDEMELVEPAIRQAADAVEDWIFHGTRYVMDRYNQKPQE